jgi:hypothetical protein
MMARGKSDDAIVQERRAFTIQARLYNTTDSAFAITRRRVLMKGSTRPFPYQGKEPGGEERLNPLIPLHF